MLEKIIKTGIFLVDEPEPTKQLSLIHFIHKHPQSQMSQFIIATHYLRLMPYPRATIYEINDDGMKEVPLEETEQYSLTKAFLNNPEGNLRFLR